jgi:thiosulfate/3-mercaptopyruvate sulfurtransferase
MNTIATRSIGLFATLTLVSGLLPFCCRADEPWTEKELKDPAALAAAINDPKAPKPLIFNIGPVQQIKGAIAIGPTSSDKNLDKLKQQLAKVPKDKEVIIYCGCCPFRRCPNVRPAFGLLKKLKFTNAKLLNLPTSLDEDWINKGYPVE